jgi:hypothetical protein
VPRHFQLTSGIARRPFTGSKKWQQIAKTVPPVCRSNLWRAPTFGRKGIRGSRLLSLVARGLLVVKQVAPLQITECLAQGA